jgi:hypothetical protein
MTPPQATPKDHLMNFRIPSHLKTRFQQLCRNNHSTMTTELIRLVNEYLKQEEPKTMDHIRLMEPSPSIEPTSDTHLPRRLPSDRDTTRNRHRLCPETGLPLEFWT